MWPESDCPINHEVTIYLRKTVGWRQCFHVRPGTFPSRCLTWVQKAVLEISGSENGDVNLFHTVETYVLTNN